MKKKIILILIFALLMSINSFAIEKKDNLLNYKDINPYHNSKINLFWQSENNLEWIEKDDEFLSSIEKYSNNLNLKNFIANQIREIEEQLQVERNNKIVVDDINLYPSEITENIIILNLAKNKRLNFLDKKIGYQYPLDEIDNNYLIIDKKINNDDLKYQWIKIYEFLKSNNELKEYLINKSVYLSPYKLKGLKGYTTNYPNENQYIYLGIEDDKNTRVILKNYYSNSQNDILKTLLHEIGHLFFKKEIKDNSYLLKKYKALTNSNFIENNWNLNTEESFSEYFKIYFYPKIYAKEQYLYEVKNKSNIKISQDNFNNYLKTLLR